jgi:ribulose 1,5-bisphosphate synthetase/thiazole synthase
MSAAMKLAKAERDLSVAGAAGGAIQGCGMWEGGRCF